MKRVALIIANRDFRDEEFFVTRDVLVSKGIKVQVFSNEIGLALGRFGGEVIIKNCIENLIVDDFDAIVFIGGSGALERLDNSISYDLIRSFAGQGKIVAAICISPVILAKSGVLEGKTATVWFSAMDKSAVAILTNKGAKYADLPVVVDGNVITGRDYEASSEFALKVALLLTNGQKSI